MKIGIFDSGHGGRFVAKKLARLLPHHEYLVVDDAAHAPYGERSYQEVASLTTAAIAPLLDCDIVVLACNTATAAAIDILRQDYPDRLFVGFEPMIKPAAQASTSSHITLLATNATVNSQRTKQLITNFGQKLTIDTPGTAGWATAIDNDLAESIDLSAISDSLASGSDTIIIGCTHYIALIPRLRQLSATVTILEPTESVARRINQLAD